MEALTDKEFADKIGMFLDEYIQQPDGGKIPRTVPYFREAFKVLLAEGIFRSPEEIRKACLKTQYAIIPNFLFENIS